MRMETIAPARNHAAWHPEMSVIVAVVLLAYADAAVRLLFG